MARQIIWTKQTLETFIEEAYLTDEEVKLLRTRIAGWTITEQADDLGISVGTVNRMIRRMKLKYDMVQRLHPDIMPVRKMCAAELFMDSH